MCSKRPEPHRLETNRHLLPRHHRLGGLNSCPLQALLAPRVSAPLHFTTLQKHLDAPTTLVPPITLMALMGVASQDSSPCGVNCDVTLGSEGTTHTGHTTSHRCLRTPQLMNTFIGKSRKKKEGKAMPYMWIFKTSHGV